MSLVDAAIVRLLPAVPRPVVRKISERYIAGEELDDALRLVRLLNDQGKLATIDVLGEEIAEPDEARAIAGAYREAFEAIERGRLDSNVSIKPTALGLKLGYDLFRSNLVDVVSDAARRGNFVRIDMEDNTTTDATLRIYRELHGRLGNLGCVLQAYMRRTLRDIDELPAEKPSVRLCKGIYVEPRKIAWKGYDTVRANYVAALEKLLVRGIYVGIATHDEYLAAQAVALVDKHGVERDRYEFQMLLGVDDELRRILVAGGHRLRVYVPYGRDWYPYSMRRLRENPEVARHVLRALISGR